MKPFHVFLHDLLGSWVDCDEVRAYLLQPESVAVYNMAFSCMGTEGVGAIDIPAPHNGTYEAYEQIGDSIIKVFMTTYFYRRFPRLWNNNYGVKIVARLIIKYGSKDVLASFADHYGFLPYIQFGANTETLSDSRRMSIMEDVFEAFIGATAVIVDYQYGAVGVGLIISLQILEKVFNAIDVPLTFEQLFDAKTRLKEMVDVFRFEIQYVAQKQGAATRVDVVWDKTIIGTATSAIKARAEQQAAEMALAHLNMLGYAKDIPKEYLAIINEP